MKKLLITSVVLSAVVTSFAQGYINYGNTTGTIVTTNSIVNYLGTQVNAAGVTGNASASGVAPQGFYYALLVQSYSGTTAGNAITSLSAEGWSFGGIYATNSLSSGRFTGGTDVGVSGTTAGGNYQFVVVGFSANETTDGADWAQILNSLTTGSWLNQSGVVGISSVGVVNSIAGAPPSTSSTLFGVAPGIVAPFVLDSVAVPEPGTLALAALGGASLLMFRRKK
jgi:hypothetical protein